MSALTLPKGTAQALRDVTGEERPDIALIIVLRDAVAFRLQDIADGIRAFETKYGVPFDQYQERWDAEEREEDYSWEAEQDFLDWEALVARRQRLENVYGWFSRHF
jgi:hypothetical protein